MCYSHTEYLYLPLLFAHTQKECKNILSKKDFRERNKEEAEDRSAMQARTKLAKMPHT